MAKNEIRLIGTVASDVEYAYTYDKENFYKFTLASKRTSNVEDFVPCYVSQHFFDLIAGVGNRLEITGEVRTRNIEDSNGKKHLEVYVFVENVSVSALEETNIVEIEGYICKEPIYRETPLGRQITDFVIAVNNTRGRSYYAPCIAWGRSAIYASYLEVGRKVSVKGRFQSREYNKNLPDGTSETRTAYEISTTFMKEINKDE